MTVYFGFVCPTSRAKRTHHRETIIIAGMHDYSPMVDKGMQWNTLWMHGMWIIIPGIFSETPQLAAAEKLISRLLQRQISLSIDHDEDDIALPAIPSNSPWERKQIDTDARTIVRKLNEAL